MTTELSDPPSSEPETKAQAESLIPLFKFTRVLNQDQNGRRISLLGNIHNEPGILILERAAFSSDESIIRAFLRDIHNVKNLGANDIYRWYMGNHFQPFQRHSDGESDSVATPLSSLDPNTDNTSQQTSHTVVPSIPDLKINLIYPCTPTHIKKYTAQRLRYVTETPHIYTTHIRPWIEATQRTAKRLDWIYNILDGRTEQEDVVYRSSDFGRTSTSSSEKNGFLLLPDLNWDRRTVSGTHLLALVERRDIWSVRDLQPGHVAWLKHLRNEAVTAAAGVANTLARQEQQQQPLAVVEPDQFKTYIHYPPTYYHFHVHVVHIALEAEGGTQAVGKALGLENVIAQLECMGNMQSKEPGPGMSSLDLTFGVGEESELWKGAFGPLKNGEPVTLGNH